MKMFIPTIGDMIKLSEDWTFDLYYEYRNHDLFKDVGWDEFFDYKKNKTPPCPYTIKKDSILIIDRIYIRQKASEFDSVTFIWKNGSTNNYFGKNGVRFWTKLEDVNNIVFEIANNEKDIPWHFNLIEKLKTNNIIIIENPPKFLKKNKIEVISIKIKSKSELDLNKLYIINDENEIKILKITDLLLQIEEISYSDDDSTHHILESAIENITQISEKIKNMLEYNTGSYKPNVKTVSTHDIPQYDNVINGKTNYSKVIRTFYINDIIGVIL